MREALEMVRTMINGANEYEKKTGDKNPPVYFSKDNLLIIEQALHRLESIDNSNPSEALECLETIWCDISTNYINEYVAIKQALLKAQEPKHYLKWEDLEFKETHKIKILMNGNLYNLLCYDEKYIEIRTIKGEYMLTLDNDNSEDKQFFNDLRLERVEE